MAVGTAHIGMMIFTAIPGTTTIIVTTGLTVSNSAERRPGNPGKRICARSPPARTAITLTGPDLRAFPPQTVLPKGRSFPALDHALRVSMPALPGNTGRALLANMSAHPGNTGHALRVSTTAHPGNTGRVLRANMSVPKKNAGRAPLYRRNSAHGLVLKSTKHNAVNRAGGPVRTGKVRETGQDSVPAAEPANIS